MQSRGVTSQRRANAPSRHHGLIEGCAVFDRGTCGARARRVFFDASSPLPLTMIVFGHGQGLVMAPLSGAVLSTVKPAAAGSASGRHDTIAQIGNAAGVAAIDAAFFAVEDPAIRARGISRLACAVYDIKSGLRRIPDVDARRPCTKLRHLWLMPGNSAESLRFRRIDSARSFYFATQQLSGLAGR